MSCTFWNLRRRKRARAEQRQAMKPESDNAKRVKPEKTAHRKKG